MAKIPREELESPYSTENDNKSDKHSTETDREQPQEPIPYNRPSYTSGTYTFDPDTVPLRTDLYGIDRSKLVQELTESKNFSQTEDFNFNLKAFEKMKTDLKNAKQRKKQKIQGNRKSKLKIEDEVLRSMYGSHEPSYDSEHNYNDDYSED